MNATTVTKTLNNETLKDTTMSLGFRRFFVLPNRVKQNVLLAFYLRTKSTDNHAAIVSHFADMSDAEYINFLKLA